MSPNMMKTPLPLLTEELVENVQVSKETKTVKKSWKNLWCYFGDEDMKWKNIMVLTSIHLFFLYSVYHILIVKKLYYMLFFFYIFYGYVGAFGVTAGAHRYYTHKCYKVKLPLRIFLVMAHASAGMNSMFHWVRDHRIHHKFTDTEADPHNASRGFFFSHVGWLMVKKNPAVIREGRKVDMSDVLEDPVVQFQEKHFGLLSLMLCHVIPILIPWYFWNYELWDCFCMNMIKWVYLINGVWAVNSAAHIWGTKPYDKNILPTENKWVSFIAIGEGWHNYHHTFPWDYKAAELSWWLNVTGVFLNIFAALGWVYDLKTPSQELIERVVKSRGDGSRLVWGKEVPETEEKQSID
ncbi:stearoyl-CoA desaturase 5-like [Coccinella septempunctata]|uniref:stearoyl-CoA desaturase 5-like n=1 Tax=Coccinella septempunctata TaxID=41139 RepID=UPI001D0985B1|nr:stearoyl-CoA desaturase 5-like [Coccinella septempunctata]XP_044756466.1 stearoyl-CoA desaturase 5-like [Coccinella septempunctata]XP_044756467.1 stearoyl-CoA desaturase 5-like [Coccinella septempunctata]